MNLTIGIMTETAILIVLAVVVIAIVAGIVYKGPNEKGETTLSEDVSQAQNEQRQKKGTIGERKIYAILENLKGSKGMLPNCYLPLENGETTEIDLILIHESGIYVIESKNFGGWIFGNDTQKFWTQSFSDGRGGSKKYKFYNPLWQNEMHIRAVQKILENSRVNIYSYIVFGDDCQLMSLQLSRRDCYVVQQKELLAKISENAVGYGQLLSNKMIEECYQKLLPYACVTQEQKEEHIRNLQKMHEQDALKCPWCGGRLVLRTPRNPANASKKFYGCSNYPKCKYIRDITQSQ